MKKKKLLLSQFSKVPKLLKVIPKGNFCYMTHPTTPNLIKLCPMIKSVYVSGIGYSASNSYCDLNKESFGVNKIMTGNDFFTKMCKFNKGCTNE